MTFKSVLKLDRFFLLVLIALAIFIRSLNFSESLNFSTDQAKFSIKALEILRAENESTMLIGPSISLQLEGREIYQGGLIYYFQALFLFFGNLDPLVSSYLFMLFACFMTIPLYFGVKFLTNSSGNAKLVTVFYCLLPLFINYTKFFWNPNFQLALLPLLFLFLGLYKKNEKLIWLFLAGVWFGIIFQFHYQLFIGGIILLLYLKFYLKTPLGRLLLFIAGFGIGFLPIIIDEFRHDFSNFRSLLFYIENFGKFSDANSGAGLLTNRHYFLSLIMIVLLSAVSLLKKISLKPVYAVALFLTIVDLFLYIPKPNQGFGMAANWNFNKELEVSDIIKEQNTSGYNVTNLNYDTLASVQKYFYKKDNLEGKLTDYWQATRMFVIAPKMKDIYNDSTYEIQVVKPFKVIQRWNIGDSHILYLLEKA